MSDAPKDAKMVHAGLCTVVDELGTLPIFGHIVDGNQNGHTSITQQLGLLKKHLKPPALTMISDRGTFSAGHLLRLGEAGYHAIAAAPWQDFRALFDEQFERWVWKKASYLFWEQQRRRKQGNLPQEHYELAARQHELIDRDSGCNIPCRVVFVYSTADQKVAQKNREKSISKIREVLERIAQSVAQGRRNTDPTSVARRVSKVLRKHQEADYFKYEMVPLKKNQRDRLPTPQRGCKQPEHRFEFTFYQQAVEHDAEYDGYSVLVTTAPRSQSADQIFSKYK